MPFAAFILTMLAAAAQPGERPIVVTGNPWAPFISPMGEPFRPHSSTDDTLADWFRQADRNHDGVLTLDEIEADADRFFTRLDTSHDGQIDPDELVKYEWEVAPDIQLASRQRRAQGEKAAPDRARRPQAGDDDTSDEAGRRRGSRPLIDDGPQGAARYSLLNIPEPVAAADADFDRAITRAEFRQAAIDRFQLLDSGRRGGLTLPQLEAMRTAILATAKGKRPRDVPDSRVGLPLPPGRN
jgi:Ca2+-binding EF-hand superfamily protein